MVWVELESVIQSKVSQKEKKKYINAYIWHLERWYWWTYFQGRNRDTDIENELVDTMGEEEGGMSWERSIWHIYTTMYKKDS